MTTGTRLPACERRRAILDAAGTVFASGGYRGSTTAEIARACGISEPILYRHFGSKRDLYLAVLDDGWAELRDLCEAAIAAEPDPTGWLAAIGDTYNGQFVPAELFLQSLTEGVEDPKIRVYLRSVVADLHDYVTGVIRRAQAAGGILPERDPEAEAWLFVAGGVLSTVGRRIGLLADEDFRRIGASRLEWLAGCKSA